MVAVVTVTDDSCSNLHSGAPTVSGHSFTEPALRDQSDSSRHRKFTVQGCDAVDAGVPALLGPCTQGLSAV